MLHRAAADMIRLAALLATCFTLFACTTAEGEFGDDADIIVGEDKEDGVPGVELTGFLAPDAPVDGVMTPSLHRIGYLVYAASGAKVDLEVTRAGSSTGLDTVLKVYGPRASDGTYPSTDLTDDDAGSGPLSKLTGKSLPGGGGFYLVEVAAKTAPTATKTFRVALRCTGTCTRPGPAAPIGADMRWVEKSAEYRALALQAYNLGIERLNALAASGLPGNWAVVLDIDETTLINVAYQRERAELGTGYSFASWTAWVKRKAAPAMPGVKAFTERVRALGGKVVLVSNRKAGIECDPTAENLAAAGIRYDGMLCRTDTSDKNPRFDAIEAGTAPGLPALTTVMYVGDNIKDFPALSQDIRTESDASFADFGHQFLLIPNPMYGSWETN
jgi:5'-nucleotidase (lipoprotein e(P4) family)